MRLSSAITFLNERAQDCLGRDPADGHHYRDEMISSLGQCVALDAELRRVNAELLEVCRRWDYYRAALLAMEYEVGSPSVEALLDDTRAALTRAKGA